MVLCIFILFLAYSVIGGPPKYVRYDIGPILPIMLVCAQLVDLRHHVAEFSVNTIQCTP